MKKRMRIFLFSITLIGLIVSTSCAASKTPTITTNSLSEGTEGVAYSQTLQVHGGTPPYTWFAMATLPPGLQLDPLSGVISGTPLAGWGPAFVSFQVTDHTGMGSEKQLLITVNPTTALTSTTTTTSNIVGSASSSSTNGLKLSLSVDSTPNIQHQISITLDETNTLSKINNVPVSDNWLYKGLGVAPCDFTSPYGIALFSGDYNSSTLSTGTPLTLYDPHVARLCPTNYPVISYSFQPSLDWAQVIENPANPLNNSQQMQYELTINGYWPDDNFSSNSQLTNFAPGVYTVVGGDEWGNLIVLHFTFAN
jgi:hypothetical protein